MPRRVSATAPCRVDLGGGTLDIWPLGLLHPGARTVNVAVDLPVTAQILPPAAGAYTVGQGDRHATADSLEALAADPDGALVATVLAAFSMPPVTVRLASASPRGGGLGASSALVVALIAACEAWLERPPSDAERRAAVARDLEARLMGLPTGRQDHYPALLGGALEILHEPGGERVRSLAVDLELLAASLVVAYTAQSHFSAGQNWQVVRQRLDGDPQVARLLAEIVETVRPLPAALEAGDLATAGALVEREWTCRSRLASGISTPAIEHLLAVARGAGGWGGKACGAGGGGCVAILAPPDRRAAVVAAVAAGGGEPIDLRPVDSGLRVDVD